MADLAPRADPGERLRIGRVGVGALFRARRALESGHGNTARKP